jgi:hypothetical protein
MVKCFTICENVFKPNPCKMKNGNERRDYHQKNSGKYWMISAGILLLFIGIALWQGIIFQGLIVIVPGAIALAECTPKTEGTDNILKSPTRKLRPS